MKISTLLFFFLLFQEFQSIGQIPNNGFENWMSTSNYDTPLGWETMNIVCPGPFYSCKKSFDHYPATAGNYSVRIENNTSLTQQTGGYGIIVTHAFDYPYKPAFPITSHPNSLKGYYKYDSKNNDTMFVRIVLFHQGNIVSTNMFTSIGTNASWNTFDIPLPSYSMADSATIIMSAFLPMSPTDGPNGNSVLYVDNISFDNFILAADDLNQDNTSIKVFPNPVKNTVILKTEGSGNHELQIEMYNIIGRRVKSVRLDEDSKEIDVSNLENGIYILGINTKEHQQKIKFTIQR